MVTREQLLTAGLSVGQIDRLISAGHVIRIHRGVYLVGHRAVHPLAYETAALLACRPHALLSHHTAARFWMLPVPGGGPIHVTVVGRHRRSLDGVAVHTLAHLPRTELRRHAGLPITSPSLTLLDLAAAAGQEALANALNESRILRLVTDDQLRASLRAHPCRKGAKALGALLDAERGPTVTRSEAERRALKVMRAHGVEPDESDVRIGPYRVDFLFRRERLAVEVDGYRYHATPKRFVDDRRRIAFLATRNIQVFPLTWVDVHGEVIDAMERLRRTLGERRKLFPQ